ncbi:MAG: hypothetical protein HY049_03195 [Acidobacteria bacterium]|nr:hypothetical protein [Acidobacteriota bacterium]
MDTIRLATEGGARGLRRALAAQRAIESAVKGARVATVISSGLTSLRDGTADAAVLRAADPALDSREGAVLVAVLSGRDARYRCVSRSRPALSLLLPGARVAAADDVALAQMRAAHPLLRLERIGDPAALPEQLRHGEWAAACLPVDAFDGGAFWGLRVETMEVEEILPPAGQGAIALLAARSDARVREALRSLDDRDARRCVDAERTFVRESGDVPGTVAAAHAIVRDGRLELCALIAEEDGRWIARDAAEAESVFGEILAREVADSCGEAAARLSRAGPGLKRAASF